MSTPPPASPSSSRKQRRRHETGYFLSTFALGAPFASFVTYVGFELQNIGYAIGHVPGAPAGTGCPATASSCRVPFAKGSGSGAGAGADVNLTSYILYLNAIVYALSGALTLVVSGVGDYVAYQREQYVAQLLLYGVLCLPIASLRGSDVATFNALSGLYVVFNVVGFIAGAWMNIFIPFVMHEVEEEGFSTMTTPPLRQVPSGSGSGNSDDDNDDDGKARKAIADGMRMGVWGANGLSAGQIILFIVSIGLTFASAAYAGLYTTTASGVLCIIIALAAWHLLPAPQAKRKGGDMTVAKWLKLPLTTFSLLFRQVWEYPESFKFLLAYTIYNDTLFAFGSVTSQLFNLNIRPGLREFTYYSLVQPVAAILSATAFLYLRPVARDHVGLTLRHWVMLSYAATCFVALWCAVGIAPSATVGFKQRWEFYAFQALQSAAASVAGVAFRVLFSRLFPRGCEIRFFGFQLVLSLATVWVPQIVNGPVVDATDNLRLPAAISAALLLLCVVVTFTVDEEKGMRQVGYGSTGD